MIQQTTTTEYLVWVYDGKIVDGTVGYKTTGRADRLEDTVTTDYLDGTQYIRTAEERAERLIDMASDKVCLIERVIKHWKDKKLEQEEHQPMFERGHHKCFPGGPHYGKSL